jgi:tRNA-specific 2-thiouridylase
MKRVIVGMSGGVDSSVAALLLKQQGYQVEGLFMRNWEADQNDPYCTADQDLTDARSVCDSLNIPLHTVNFSKTYWDTVFQHFLDEYAAARTPNPDILCNREIKFKAFLDYAIQQGADYIATGHYARIAVDQDKFQLLKGVDDNKDQSYFLHAIEETALKRSLFPLGELKKTQVREIAQQAGFANHRKKDSTGICFIGERKFKDFLREYLLTQPGNIETETGEIIGKHQGLMFHTLGQRQGLGIGGRKNSQETPWYVMKKDVQRNVVIVTQSQTLLYQKELICAQMNWISGVMLEHEFTCSAKIRYRQPDQVCKVLRINDAQYQVDFLQPQWAITPGQSVVFYQQEVCLGGGVII